MCKLYNCMTANEYSCESVFFICSKYIEICLITFSYTYMVDSIGQLLGLSSVSNSAVVRLAPFPPPNNMTPWGDFQALWWNRPFCMVWLTSHALVLELKDSQVSIASGGLLPFLLPHARRPVCECILLGDFKLGREHCRVPFIWNSSTLSRIWPPRPSPPVTKIAKI